MRNFLKKLFYKTEERVLEELRREIFQLREIIDNFPGDVYWKNREGMWLGVNKRGSESLKAMGFLSEPREVIGKTDKELFGEQTADIYRKNDFIVMDENREVSVEEATFLPSGEKVIKYSTKKPLYDKDQNIVGIIGSSMDITAQKEAEKLRLENTEQKIKIEEQQKFYKIANQLSHDMRSPLSALKILHEQIAPRLTESERVMQRNALTRFTDILNSGFVRYKSEGKTAGLVSEQKEFFMISTALEQILAEKRLEYKDKKVTFEIDFDVSAIFAFFQVKLGAFKRMISNLINNAIDAFEEKEGIITVRLKMNSTYVDIIVEDNGKGMDEWVKEKILNNDTITFGKENGNGIGFSQIRDTIEEHGALLSIFSERGVGTKIKLTFLQVPAPTWSVDRIVFTPSDLIIIIDDEASIHDAWDARFYSKLANMNQIKHFQQGKEALQFIKNLTLEEKNLVLLLTDYELIGQSINGLDIIEKTQITRAILVTSHSDEENIRERASKLKAKILPKLLASVIPIELKQVEITPSTAKSNPEIVVIDDDPLIRESLELLMPAENKLNQYESPQTFIEDIGLFAKDTVFLIDYNFQGSMIKGIDIAERLHKKGFESLYLFSGTDFTSNEVGSYLTVIKKTNTEKLKKLLNRNDE